MFAAFARVAASAVRSPPLAARSVLSPLAPAPAAASSPLAGFFQRFASTRAWRLKNSLRAKFRRARARMEQPRKVGPKKGFVMFPDLHFPVPPKASKS
eukprot:tig00020614_g12185.t1